MSAERAVRHTASSRREIVELGLAGAVAGALVLIMLGTSILHGYALLVPPALGFVGGILLGRSRLRRGVSPISW